MIEDYRFKDIEKYLKKDTNIGSDILDAFAYLTDAAIIFGPVILGSQFLPVLELLDVKDKLFNLGHKVYDFIVQKIERDYIKRTEQIRAAYALICYTAYFDIIQDTFSSTVRKKMKSKLDEKVELIKEAIETNNTLQIPLTDSEIHCNVYYADHITSFSEIKEQLFKVYEQVTNNLLKMIKETSVFDEKKMKEKQEFEQLNKILKKVPQKAIEAYEAQYIKLADQFNDFALFAQLKNFEGIYHATQKNKAALDLLVNITKELDVGFNNLNNVVNLITTDYTAIQAQNIVDDLKSKYTAMIEEPIIDDKEIKSNTETIPLRFPRIIDAFIPQLYKCFSYQHEETKLEDNECLWNQLPTQYDLDNFFIKYLYSPDSIDYPLIILGQPGSGKSLLTKVLSAQLMSNSYTVVRIPLREINAEDGIDILVEDQIKKITNRPLSTQGYGGFAAQFNEKPLIIILDGYDELLQAKGDIFSGYLERIRTFQQDQKQLKRPVRIIVTSRITLIDKARIPINSTVLRLMEFNPQQRQAWINIWNSNNADYFTSNNIKPFNLSFKDKEKKNSIIELAEQPLLLLMLALYDSEANELAKTNNIKRTELYDNLLRRFVRRERRRYVPEFAEKSPDEQEIIIDQEMNRLGVIAIGMYNRQEVVILSKQLEQDLDAFNARRNDGSPKARTLKESESVLGGFFFIHKSIAQDNEAHSDNSESAYEFLHNTFGEFLAADFILRNTIIEVKDIFVNRKFSLSGEMHKLSNPDSLNPRWFYCLMFVPLYSRPVVIEMLREHAIKALQRILNIGNFSIKISKEEFIENLKFLVKNQLKMILNTRNTPSVMREGVIFDQDIPLLGYLSIYSLNLIILASVLSDNGFEFDEREYYNPETNTINPHYWDKLISLWKAWFLPSDLMGLSVILKAKRKSEFTVFIECNKKFEAPRYEEPIDILLCVSNTLADNLIIGLSGLQTSKFHEITKMNNSEILKILKEEDYNLYFSYLIYLLRKEINENYYEKKNLGNLIDHYKKVNEIIKVIICNQEIENVNNTTLLNIFETFEYCILKNMISFSTQLDLMKIIPHLINRSNISIKKIHRESERFYGVRILNLLVKNKGFLLSENYDMLHLRHLYFDEEWVRENNHLAYQFSRSMINDRELIQDVKIKNVYELSLANVLKNTFFQRKEDIEHAFGYFYSLEDMKILLETNSELMSFIILEIAKKGFIKGNELNRISEIFFKNCLEQLEMFEMAYVEFNVIINAINLARSVKATWFLNEIKIVLRRQILDRHSRCFMTIICLYPQFISDLIDIMPEIFKLNFNYLETYYLQKESLKYNDSEFFNYIKIFRFFYQKLCNKKVEKEIVAQGLRIITEMIIYLDMPNTVNLANLTGNQISNLIWYADLINDKDLLKKIKDDLKYNFEG